jgi:hypothetical protein
MIDMLIGLALAAFLLRSAERVTARQRQDVVPLRIRDERRRP